MVVVVVVAAAAVVVVVVVVVVIVVVYIPEQEHLHNCIHEVFNTNKLFKANRSIKY
jgi:hypothetical protein